MEIIKGLLISSELSLLQRLYKIHSPSGNEGRLSKFVLRRLKRLGCTYWQDAVGNIYAVKGDGDTFPCIVAHLDQVQQPYPKKYKTHILGTTIMGWSSSEARQCGLGADDKNGIYIALTAMKYFDNIKVAFFVSEEVGCVGSSQCDLDFFKDCRFIIEPDRSGSSDLITTMSGVPVCSKEFIKAIPFERYGYKEVDGIFTDVLELVERGVGISCLNLSCGYYHPHTDRETTNLYDLGNCRAFVFDIITRCTDVYPFELPKEYKKQTYIIKDDYNYMDDYEYWQSMYNNLNENKEITINKWED